MAGYIELTEANFDETIKDASSIVQKLSMVYKQLNLLLNVEKVELNGTSEKINPFLDSLANDINLPNAVTNLLDVIKEANIELRKKEKNIGLLKEDFYALTKMSYILGLHFAPLKLNDIDLNLYQNYLDAKSQRDFEKSDILRKELIEKGIL